MQLCRVLVVLAALAIVVSQNAKANITENEKSLDYKKAIELIKDLNESAKLEDQPSFMKNLRNLVKMLPKENLKIMGIDLNTWTLRVGTATYYEGDFMDITLAPFWPRLKTHAHILHNSGNIQLGIGYIRGETIITKEKAVHSIFRSSKILDTLTKVIAYGEGEINSNGAVETKEACEKLEAQWDDLFYNVGSKADEQTFVVITADLYCPTVVRKMVGDFYKELTLETAYANDGTPIDIIANSIQKRNADAGKEEKSPAKPEITSKWQAAAAGKTQQQEDF